jgi:hypothetical protein
MGKVKSKIECRWCHRVEFVDRLKKDHGRFRPVCMYLAAWHWMREREYALAGRDARVLELAGLVRWMPAGRPYVWLLEELVDEETGEVKFRHVWNEAAIWEPVAPKWSVELARQLMDNQLVIEAFGVYKLEARDASTYRVQRDSLVVKQKRATGKHAGKTLNQAYKRVIDIGLRARILKTAAQSGITQELFADDIGAAMTLIKSML